jgi:hypothetical protein
MVIKDSEAAKLHSFSKTILESNMHIMWTTLIHLSKRGG